MGKFRGSGDDWLDDEHSSSRTRTSRKYKQSQAPKAEPLPLEGTNAVVAEVFPKQCRVRMDDAGREFLCTYRRASICSALVEDEDGRERSPVTVGDRVHVDEKNAVVDGLSLRRNVLVRHAPGREERKILHAVAANVDRLVIVASALTPDFNQGIVDRFLVAALAAGIEPLICVTKIDLWEQETRKPWDIYLDLGYAVQEVCSKKGAPGFGHGLDQLQSALGDKVCVFCGHSGVGKTSLLRALLNRDIGKIGDVNAFTGKGRHTTTSSVLIDARWIDTPGIREFGLVGVTAENLHQYFPELAQGKTERQASYQRILEGIRELETSV